MMRCLTRGASLAGVFLVVTGCGGDDGAVPAADGPPVADASPVDAGADAAGEFPRPGFGVITGACNVLDDELTSPDPDIIDSAIDFARLYTDADVDLLTAGGQEMIADGNAGGSSLLSEVFSFEVLDRCESATLLKTETEVNYDVPDSAITDLLVAIDDEKIGVSVTRAVGYPFEDPYTVMQAKELLERKLADIQESSASVSAEDRWAKQILAVLAYAPEHAESLHAALAEIDATVKADTIVWIVVSNGADDFIYCDGACE
ncbi:MAG TPA: hypothetical protein VFG83_02510 [Kofleriaceae bacterium]|nr:hypothetical protein [Kofleriaceae bacterium]